MGYSRYQGSLSGGGGGGGSGDVSGPASSTDNAIARFSGTDGETIQNSIGILSDAGVLGGLTGLSSSGTITFSGLTASRALTTNGSSELASSATTTTELGYVSGVTSAIQTQLNGKATNTLADGSIFIGDASNEATAQAVSGDISISNAGVVAISSGAIVNADVNASAGIAYSKLNLSDSILNADINSSAAIAGTKIDPDFGAQNVTTSGTLSGSNFSGSSSGSNTGDQTITLTGDVTGSGTGSFAATIGAGIIDNANINASAAIDYSKLAALTADRALVSDGSGFVFASDITATEIGYLDGVTSNIQGQLDAASGDNSWTALDAGSGQITFNSGSRNVNGIVTTIAADVTTNSTVVAITNDTLTTLDATDGLFYEASDTIRIWTFYDTIDLEFKQIGNTTDDTKWDYRTGDNADFIAAGINLSRHVPIGYIDVTASASPGTVSVSITNFPVQAWTTYNNTAAAGPWESWTPTLSTSAGTLSSTAFQTQKWRRVGAQVQFELAFTTTLSGAVTSYIGFTGPATPLNDGIVSIGSGYCNENSTNQQAVVQRFTDGTLRILDQDLSGFATGSISVRVFGQYQISEADAYNALTVGFPNVSDLVQTKTLATNQTTDGTMTELTTTVKPGYTYEIKGTFRTSGPTSGPDNIKVSAFDGATQITGGFVESANSAGAGQITLNRTWTAVGSSITFQASSLAAGSTINSANDETFVQITEVPQAGVGVLLDQLAYGEKILGSNVSSTGDISALSFTNLTIGRWYEVSGQVHFPGGSAGNTILDFHDVSSAGGNQLGRVLETEGDVETKAVNFKFLASTTNLYSNLSAATNAIGGTGNKDRTFIQVRELALGTKDTLN